jgi:transporter family protein
MWILFALISALAAAFVAIFAKLGLKSVDPVLGVTIRTIVMVVFLVIFSLIQRKFSQLSISDFATRDWLYIVLAGLAGAISLAAYFYALKIGQASRVVAIDKLSLAFTMILAVLILGEALNWKVILGGIIMVIGAILIAI